MEVGPRPGTGLRIILQIFEEKYSLVHFIGGAADAIRYVDQVCSVCLDDNVLVTFESFSEHPSIAGNSDDTEASENLRKGKSNGKQKYGN